MSRVTLSALIKAASRMSEFSESEIRGEGRARDLVHVRWAIASAARELGYSSPFIGRHLGNRDHSTIVYGWQQWPELVKREPDYMAWQKRMVARAIEDTDRARQHIRVTFACFTEAPV